MAKFNDLTEQDRIQYVKDGLILILEQLAKDPSKLKNYIKIESPKVSVPAFEKITDTTSDAEKALIEERNKALQIKVDIENEKLKAEFALKEEGFKKVQDIVSNLKKKELCFCGSCINIDIISSVVPKELDILIDVARKEAEERHY